MVFNSYSFLFLFFPIFFILYRKVPLRWCLPLLCAGSLVFYAVGVWDRLWQLLLLLGMTLFGFLGCLLFRREKLRKKWLLALWLCVTAAPLAYVKLAGLFLPQAPGLPLGLSFYTFQQIALLVFAWQGGFVTAEEYAAGILMFPKLISGPLAEPEELLDELDDPRRSLGRLAEGLEDFILGLACKVIVADHLAGILGPIRVRGVLNVSVGLAWLGVLGYALRLYFDFWGYSRMAVGQGKMLGFRLPENFDHPYLSKSATEFWRRWHISLGTWFREYVYIPLGGNRVGRFGLIRNTMIVWLLTGIWHGADWNFMLWGLYYGILLMLEKLVFGRALEKLPSVLRHVYCMFVVMIGWYLFSFNEISGGYGYLAALFGGGGSFMDRGSIYQLYSNAVLLIILIIGSTTLPIRAASAVLKKVRRSNTATVVLRGAFTVCVFMLSVAYLVSASYNPFLYFRF